MRSAAACRHVRDDVHPVRLDLHCDNPRAVGLEGGVARGDMDPKAAFEKRGQFGVNHGGRSSLGTF